jgi:hypothetical protein
MLCRLSFLCAVARYGRESVQNGAITEPRRNDHQPLLPTERPEQAQAAARWILRRVGIPPLLTTAIIVAPVSTESVSAQTPPRATAVTIARARIVSDAVRVGATVDQRAGVSQNDLAPRPRVRSCGPVPAGSPSQAACRMIVIDMP